MTLSTDKALRISQLDFGQIDARSEVSTRDMNKKQFFIDSFVIPKGVVLEEYYDGSKFFVFGSKGSGKTALLRYLQLELQDRGFQTRFFLFSEDISEQERKQLLKISDAAVIDKPELHDDTDAQSAWTLFFHRKIADVLSENEIIERNDGYAVRQYVNLCKALYDGQPAGLLNRLLSLVNKGIIKLKAKTNNIEAEGELELKDSSEILVHTFVNKLDVLLSGMSFLPNKGIYIFMDELNLSMTSRIQHKRDSILIRDLIVSVGRLNRRLAEAGVPIILIAAIRTEVLGSVNVAKNEVYKYLYDAGREIEWFGRAKYDHYPIFGLIEKKIQASEARVLGDHSSERDLWNKYFGKELFGVPVKQFVIETTWCNPRDIVLLMGEACKEHFGYDRIDFRSIRGVLESYSSTVWRERVEELSVDYAPAEIAAIKRLLIGYFRNFKRDQFHRHGKARAEYDAGVMQLIRGRDANRVLEDLYWCGVLGQSYRKPEKRETRGGAFVENWLYRGQMDYDGSAWHVVHRGLWPELKLGQYSATDFALGDQFVL